MSSTGQRIVGAWPAGTESDRQTSGYQHEAGRDRNQRHETWPLGFGRSLIPPSESPV